MTRSNSNHVSYSHINLFKPLYSNVDRWMMAIVERASATEFDKCTIKTLLLVLTYIPNILCVQRVFHEKYFPIVSFFFVSRQSSLMQPYCLISEVLRMDSVNR